MINTLPISRRSFLASLSCLALGQTLLGCETWSDQPVSIAAHLWPGYEPMFLARRETWLDSNQVQLLETNSATETLQALIEGEVDGAALTLDETLKARATGLPLTVVLIFDISTGADMLLARPYIKQLADLKGQRLGFEQSSVGELMLAEILSAAGLSRQEVKLMPLSIDQHRAAWDRNQLDAVISYEPVASQLLAQQGIKLFDSRQLPNNTIIDVLALRTDKLDYSHATALRHLLAAHFRALDYLNRNPQDSAYRIASHLGLPAAEVLNAFKGLVLPDVSNNHRILAGAEPKLQIDAQKLSKLMVRNNLLKQEDTLSSLIRADFLPTDFHSYRP